MKASTEGSEDMQQLVRQLEEELSILKAHIRDTASEHELRVTKLVESNEELRSTLGELRSINTDLKTKIEDAMLASNNLHNLINSVDIATVFLDRDFCVAFFTPQARELFDLSPSDYGRPLSDITGKLVYEGVIADAKIVLGKLQPVEREVQTTEGRMFIMRILPYRTAEDRVNGVVITFLDVSARKRAEEALSESEDRLRAIFDSMSEAFVIKEAILDHEGKAVDYRFIDSNPAFAVQTGLGNPRGHTVLELMPGIEPVWLESYAEVLRTGKPIQFEAYLAPLERWLAVSASRLGGPGSLRVAIVFMDITLRKQAERDVRESEKRFRTLSDTLPQLIWTNDSNGYANYFNQRWFDYTGLSYEASAGAGWQNIVHESDEEISVAQWRDALQKGHAFETEYRLRGANGIYRWFIGRNVPTYDGEGNILNWFGSATDIEELKQAEASLRDSRERMRITLESATDYAIITLDINGMITSWSKGAELIFGYREDEVKGVHTQIIFTPEDRAAGAAEKEMKQAADEGRAMDERWHLRKDGTRFYMSGVMAPIMNENTLSGFVKVARNMTEQKLLEQQKDEFIGITSHELKTPVTSIKIYADMLQQKFEAAKDVGNAALMQKLNGQVDRLTDLIRDLLDTTKIFEGQLPLHVERFSLEHLIGVRIEEWQRIAPDHKITLQSMGGEKIIAADPERIEQVLTNLISNAIKYSPENGDILITTEAKQQYVKVSVSDRGIGIPNNMIGRVFDRFFRVSNPTLQTYPGMGLGLYISAGIIKRHGGTISVESLEGKGSTFFFTLPYNINDKQNQANHYH